MKISKTQLKEIVKECLVEIMSEGLGSMRPQQRIEGAATMVERRQPASNPKKSVRDSIVFGEQQQVVDRSVIKSAAGSDPIMMGIFEDTARNTLPKMLSSETPGRAAALVESHGGPAEKIVASSTPEDLFGDKMAGKWSALAFADVAPKNR